jgi:hypothetical protein
MGFFIGPDRRYHMESEDNIVQELLGEIATLMKSFPGALEHRAAAIEATGKDPDLAQKLMKGADAMRDSGNIYLTWARHYAAMSEGNAGGSEEEDESDFGT